MEAFLLVAIYLLQLLSVMLAGVCERLLKTVIYTVNFVTGHIRSLTATQKSNIFIQYVLYRVRNLYSLNKIQAIHLLLLNLCLNFKLMTNTISKGN